MLTLIKNIIDKLFSGRWILTVACAIVFIYCSINGKLEAATITAIVISVFKDYFSRNDRS